MFSPVTTPTTVRVTRSKINNPGTILLGFLVDGQPDVEQCIGSEADLDTLSALDTAAFVDKTVTALITPNSDPQSLPTVSDVVVS